MVARFDNHNVDLSYPLIVVMCLVCCAQSFGVVAIRMKPQSY